MTPKPYIGTCIAYIQTHKWCCFYPVNFALTLAGRGKFSMKGDVVPPRSSRRLAALINPGTSRNGALRALIKIGEFIEKAKPGIDLAVGLGLEKHSEPVLLTPKLEINLAQLPPIQNLRELSNASQNLPYTLVVIPFGIRHWEDFQDEVFCATRAIEIEGLLRGTIASPLGVHRVIDQGHGKLVADLSEGRRPRSS